MTPDTQSKTSLSKLDLAAYILAAVALLLILERNLVEALFSGLVVYSVVHFLAPILERKISSERARIVAVACLAVFTVTVLTAAIWGLIVFFRSSAGTAQALLKEIADMLDSSRNQVPPWVSEYLPSDAEGLKQMITNWLRTHAVQAQLMGEASLRTAVHVLIGMIIGGMVALGEATGERAHRPLASVLIARVQAMSEAFRRIVFAQVQIAAINAALTGIFVLVVLPMADVHLPLAKTLVALTFFAGLLPIVGNLMSNTILVTVSLTISLKIAAVCLIFLVVIHKLEYFLNAKIIGNQIKAKAWELLIAMLVMESMFGLPGVIAAPIYYAYIKLELGQRDLI
ncbi:MAG TPA: AI-2E family transporter [Burkholderiaceae bacterium]|jgi:predicted PurR-regulated permease PerM